MLLSNLVSFEEAASHLRIDCDGEIYEVDWLTVFIPAVSQAVEFWVKVPERLYIPELDSMGQPVLDSSGEPVPEVDSSGNSTPLPIVKAAVLLELASQYRYREGEGKDNMVPDNAGYGHVLSKGATNLLYPLRKPTVA